MGASISSGGSRQETLSGSRISSRSLNMRRVEVPATLLVPPDRPNLVLEVLLEENWERILKLLSSKEQLQFMLTCRDARAIVQRYIDHYAMAHDVMNKLKSILNGSIPLLLNEKSLALKLKQLDETGTLGPTLIHLKAIKMFGSDLHQIRRECVSNADKFPHLGNSNYIVRRFVQSLNRETVFLRSVCWLHFTKCFKDVFPGLYEFSLRMRLNERMAWPNYNLGGDERYVTKVSALLAKNPENFDILSSTELDPEWWREIQQRKFNMSKLAHGKIQYEPLSEWLWIILEPFKLNQKADLIFEFKDVTNPHWKHGMEWDFIQLRQV